MCFSKERSLFIHARYSDIGNWKKKPTGEHIMNKMNLIFLEGFFVLNSEEKREQNTLYA